jgi:hypothetical protein
MLTIQWMESAEEYESLTVCLRALLAERASGPPTYDELIAVLGLGSATVAVPHECLGWWWTYARDVALPNVAALYGLRLRELHPPQATAGLDGSPEYAQHFRDSYVPLIAEALSHDQPVLVWRGWPQPADRFWGVVAAAESGELRGYTLGCHGKIVPLTGPAHQVYLVEDIGPPQTPPPPAAELFRQTCRAATAFWAADAPVSPDVETGERAYQRWRDAVARPPACHLCGGNSHRCVAQLMRVLGSARSHLAAWLEHTADTLEADAWALADRWAAACRRVAERCRPFEDDDAVKALLTSPLGREKLANAVDVLRALDTDSSVPAALP